MKNRDNISVEEIGSNAYSWILRHRKKYDEGKLTEYHTKKIEELDLDPSLRLGNRNLKIKEWVEENGKLPTRTTQRTFILGLVLKGHVLKQRIMTNKFRPLSQLGMIYMLKEKHEQQWFERLKQFQEFIEKNKREQVISERDWKRLFVRMGFRLNEQLKLGMLVIENNFLKKKRREKLKCNWF
ncbi:MAG: hypothetical protein R2792_13050 [Saprospiraceae bacterium]